MLHIVNDVRIFNSENTAEREKTSKEADWAAIFLTQVEMRGWVEKDGEKGNRWRPLTQQQPFNYIKKGTHIYIFFYKYLFILYIVCKIPQYQPNQI